MVEFLYFANPLIQSLIPWIEIFYTCNFIRCMSLGIEANSLPFLRLPELRLGIKVPWSKYYFL